MKNNTKQYNFNGNYEIHQKFRKWHEYQSKVKDEYSEINNNITKYFTKSVPFSQIQQPKIHCAKQMLEIHNHKDFPELFYYQMSCQAAIKIKPNSCFSSNKEVAYQPCFFGKGYIVTYSGLGKYQLCSFISGFSFWIPETGYINSE